MWVDLKKVWGVRKKTVYINRQVFKYMFILIILLMKVFWILNNLKYNNNINSAAFVSVNLSNFALREKSLKGGAGEKFKKRGHW